MKSFLDQWSVRISGEEIEGGGGEVGVLYCTHISTFMYIDI